MIPYIVYSNSSYADILEIQSDYISDKEHLILFIDKNNLDLDKIYSKYNKVIFYNNSDVYAKRLLDCLNQVEYEYFILIHEIDILLNVNEKILTKIFEWAIYNNIDKIDLKHNNIFESEEIFKIEENQNIFKCDNTINLENGLFLLKDKDPNRYLYNVNPSIWNKHSLLSIMNNFTHKTYRDIEYLDVQNFCTKFKIYKSYTTNPLHCGYFSCLDTFKFLHITHYGKILDFNTNYLTRYGSSYKDVVSDYIQIINKYNLQKSEKWIN